MMLLLKTHENHVDGVRKHRKHASDDCPNYIRNGDWLLIQVTYGSTAYPIHRVKYAMRFVDCHEDIQGESDIIWGRHWQRIIQRCDLRILRHPFDIDNIKVSSKHYGQGVIRFAYIDPADEAAILEGGFLEPA